LENVVEPWKQVDVQNMIQLSGDKVMLYKDKIDFQVLQVDLDLLGTPMIKKQI
jgi:hypothetical protein